MRVMVELHDALSLAARVAACADLRDVRLFEAEASLDQLPDRTGGLSYSLNADIEVQHVEETETLIVDGRYSLILTFEEADEDEVASDGEDAEGSGDHAQLAHVDFKLAALYSIIKGDPDLAFSDEELDAFGETVGLLALHPYAREFVANITGRMGLPPLHLGTARVPLDKRNDEHN